MFILVPQPQYASPGHMLDDTRNEYVRYYLANKDFCLPGLERREERRVGLLTQAQIVLLRSLTATLIDLRLELRYNEFACRRIGQLPIRSTRHSATREIAQWALEMCSSFVGVQAWGPRLDTIVMPGRVILVSSRRRCDSLAALTAVSVVCRGLHGRRLPSLVIDHICTFIVADTACTPEARFLTIQRINEHFRH